MFGRQSPVVPAGAAAAAATTAAAHAAAPSPASSSTKPAVAAADASDNVPNETVVEHSSAADRSKLPESLQVGATRYVLLDLGDGAGHVYTPSLALQKRPMPMQHTWRPRWDSQRGALFFVCLHDRGKLWQLPDVQDELSSALQYKISSRHSSDQQLNGSSNNNSRSSSSQHHDNKNLIDMLTADELVARAEIETKHRKESLRMRDDFRDDLVTMRRLASIQVDMLERQVRVDIDKACRDTTDSLMQSAQAKMAARRVWEDLFRTETTDRSDLRFAYDHELMGIREEEVRERVAAKVKTRTGAADAFHKFERHAVDGAEEVQRDVLLQEAAIERGRMFLEFSKLRLSGFLRLMSPVPGDPNWSPWSEEVKLEDAFIASSEFGLFYEPPAGEGVHRAWYSAKHRPTDLASEILASARVDAIAMFGDYVLGLSELHRIFLKTVLAREPGRKLSWLEAQKIIDAEPLQEAFPSSISKSKEKTVIEALRSETDWKDRALATAMSVHQRKTEERDALEKRKSMQERLREKESLQVQSYDRALGRFTRRTGQGLGVGGGGGTTSPTGSAQTTPARTPQQQGRGASTSAITGLATPRMMNMSNNNNNNMQPMLADDNNNDMANSGSKNNNARMMSRADRVLAEQILRDESAADQAAARLEMIRAIKLGQVITDKMYPASSSSSSLHYHPSSAAGGSGELGLNDSRGDGGGCGTGGGGGDLARNYPHQKNNNVNTDWSKIDNEDGGLRWDGSYSRGVAIVEDAQRAQFNPEFAEKGWKPHKICPAFTVGTVGVSRGLFIWQVNVRISSYRKFAGAPSFKVGMVSRYFGPAMEKASQRNQLLAGIASPTGKAERAMSYWYDEAGTLFCGSSGDELKEVAKHFGPTIRDGSNITVVLDLDRWFLQFFVDQKSTGVAFKFDPVREAEPLFPCVLFAAVGDEAVLSPPDAGVVAKLSLSD